MGGLNFLFGVDCFDFGMAIGVVDLDGGGGDKTDLSVFCSSGDTIVVDLDDFGCDPSFDFVEEDEVLLSRFVFIVGFFFFFADDIAGFCEGTFFLIVAFSCFINSDRNLSSSLEAGEVVSRGTVLSRL